MTPRLSEAARHVVVPKGITSTGWPAVRETCRRLRIIFDPWQDGAGSAVLAKRADGLYAADAIVVSIPRQVGKSFLVGAIAIALCIIYPGTLVLWTAHRYATAEDTFNDLKKLIEDRPEVSAHVSKIYDSAGKQRFIFKNGSRLVFGARERGFGRGFKKVAVLVFDEAQILGENAVDDMIPATNRHPNPLIFYMGTPPKPSDPSDHFQRLRTEALTSESEDTFYLEMSADEGADPLDREQWAKANPSYPIHTSARAMLRMRKNLGHESFMREGLGVWDGSQTVGVFSAGSWARCSVRTPPPPVAALAVAADLDQVWVSLGAASEGERPHLGSVLRVRLDRDRTHFVAEVARIQSETEAPVVVDAKGPAAFLIDDLELAGVNVTPTGLDDFVQACADLREAVETGRVEHGDYSDLNAAVDSAGWRTVGDRRVYARKNGDIASLEAVALALWVTRLDYNVLDSIY